jgi:cellulose synthase/poly-beta-1,6-N-acetylglucosamine synthase-like glycosyltransferase
MDVLWAVLWTSLALILWTHAGYPLAAAIGARLRRYRPRRDDGYLPSVTLIVVAHNEAGVIARRLDNALALDYPAGKLELVVASDGSTDRTRDEVERYAARGVRFVANARAGKTAAQNAAVRETSSDVVAFSDANSMWEPDALRLLVRNLADPEVGYVCGRLRLADPDGGPTTEGLYWRYELWLRAQESRLGSITAGNGAIYAVRRSAFLELGPEHSHDIAFPFRLRRLGLRSIYEPAAVCYESAAGS